MGIFKRPEDKPKIPSSLLLEIHSDHKELKEFIDMLLLFLMRQLHKCKSMDAGKIIFGIDENIM